MSFSASIADLVSRSKSPLVAKAPLWERVPLGQIASILNGYPWRSEYFNATKGYPVVRIRDVTSGTTETRYAGDFVDGFWIEDGDLLVGMDGDFIMRLWSGGRSLLNQRVCLISPDERLYLKAFLAYALPGYLDLIHRDTHSVTVKHLSSKTLAEVPLPLPPLAEQRRIVAKIDSLTGKSRRAREHLDHIPRLIEKYKQAVLAAAFATSPGGTSYPRAALDLALDDIRYGTAKKCGYGAGDIGVLRIPNVQGGSISLDDLKSANFTTSERRKLALQSGDVLVIRSNGSLGLVGRTAVVQANAEGLMYAGYLIRLRLDQSLLLPSFLHLWLQSLDARTTIEQLAKSTTGVNNINSTQLENLRLPMPDIDAQATIVHRIEIAFAAIDRFAAEATFARKLLDRLDQSILAKAFRGELVPQDPNDEPASVLLDRIRAERAATPKPKRGRKVPKE